MLNGIPNRRGRPSVKTLVLHNTKLKHWCVYIIVQQIKQSINLYITYQMGVIKI